MNRNIHEQLCSLSSRQNMSSLAHVIGLEWPKSGTFLTYVEGTMGGWFITTTSDLGTTRCQSIMATSLLVISATISTPPFKLIVLGMMQPWRGLPNLLHRSPVKLLSLVRLSVHILKLSAMTARWIPLHLSKQGIPSSLSVESKMFKKGGCEVNLSGCCQFVLVWPCMHVIWFALSRVSNPWCVKCALVLDVWPMHFGSYLVHRRTVGSAHIAGR